MKTPDQKPLESQEKNEQEHVQKILDICSSQLKKVESTEQNFEDEEVKNIAYGHGRAFQQIQELLTQDSGKTDEILEICESQLKKVESTEQNFDDENIKNIAYSYGYAIQKIQALLTKKPENKHYDTDHPVGIIRKLNKAAEHNEKLEDMEREQKIKKQKIWDERMLKAIRGDIKNEK
jgi:hypothetical protein